MSGASSKVGRSSDTSARYCLDAHPMLTMAEYGIHTRFICKLQGCEKPTWPNDLDMDPARVRDYHQQRYHQAVAKVPWGGKCASPALHYTFYAYYAPHTVRSY